MATFQELFAKLPATQQAAVLKKVAKEQAIIDAKKARSATAPAFGEGIRRIRAAARMNQQEMADRLGVRQPVIARMEQQNDIKLSTLYAIAGATGGELEVALTMPAGPSGKSTRIVLSKPNARHRKAIHE